MLCMQRATAKPATQPYAILGVWEFFLFTRSEIGIFRPYLQAQFLQWSLSNITRIAAPHIIAQTQTSSEKSKKRNFEGVSRWIPNKSTFTSTTTLTRDQDAIYYCQNQIKMIVVASSHPFINCHRIDLIISAHIQYTLHDVVFVVVSISLIHAHRRHTHTKTRIG